MTSFFMFCMASSRCKLKASVSAVTSPHSCRQARGCAETGQIQPAQPSAAPCVGTPRQWAEHLSCLRCGVPAQHGRQGQVGRAAHLEADVEMLHGVDGVLVAEVEGQGQLAVALQGQEELAPADARHVGQLGQPAGGCVKVAPQGFALKNCLWSAAHVCPPPLQGSDQDGHAQAGVHVLPILQGLVHLVAGLVRALVQPEDQVGRQVCALKHVICSQIR